MVPAAEGKLSSSSESTSGALRAEGSSDLNGSTWVTWHNRNSTSCPGDLEDGFDFAFLALSLRRATDTGTAFPAYPPAQATCLNACQPVLACDRPGAELLGRADAWQPASLGTQASQRDRFQGSASMCKSSHLTSPKRAPLPALNIDIRLLFIYNRVLRFRYRHQGTRRRQQPDRVDTSL